MSNNTKATNARKPKKTTASKLSNQVANDQAELLTYMATLDLEVTPSIHINGRSYPFALVTLDIGQPLKPNKITTEQHAEIVARMRNLGRSISGTENIRVSFDGSNGVFWAYVG